MRLNETLKPLAQDLINMGYTVYTFDENDKSRYDTYFFVGNDKVVIYVQYNTMGQTTALPYYPSWENGSSCVLTDENWKLTAQDIADIIEDFTKDYSTGTLRKYNKNLDFKKLRLYKDAKDWLDHSWSKDDFLILKNG